MSSIFNQTELEERIKEIGDDKPEYLMSICYGGIYKINTYCLSMLFKGEITIILLKSMGNEAHFKEETENLAKYFNAKIITT